MFKKLLLASVCVAGTLAVANPASALPFGPSSITVGGTTFSNFDVVLTGTSGTQPTSASQITVAANSTGDGITIASGFFASGFSFTDALVTFSAFNPNGITGANLNIAAGAFGGFAVASVAESIFNALAVGAPLANLLATCTSTSCTPADNTDPDSGYKSLGGSYTNLRVQKDINVTAVGGIGTLSAVNEGFQTTRVPEPVSLSLLGIGLLGTGLVRLRKSRSA